jgi:hypothetical protein
VWGLLPNRPWGALCWRVAREVSGQRKGGDGQVRGKAPAQAVCKENGDGGAGEGLPRRKINKPLEILHMKAREGASGRPRRLCSRLQQRGVGGRVSQHLWQGTRGFCVVTTQKSRGDRKFGSRQKCVLYPGKRVPSVHLSGICLLPPQRAPQERAQQQKH